MRTEVGEYLVGAYLRLVEECDVIDYNVRPPGGGIAGLGELDVIGFNLKKKTVFVCEVTTHILGLLYKSGEESVERVEKKHLRQKAYAKKYLSDFSPTFMFWSPNVPRGIRTKKLAEIAGLELVINGIYKAKISKLQEMAETKTYDTQNPAFRVLQILAHMRDDA